MNVMKLAESAEDFLHSNRTIRAIGVSSVGTCHSGRAAVLS
jgi:hypothetical protein